MNSHQRQNNPWEEAVMNDANAHGYIILEGVSADDIYVQGADIATIEQSEDGMSRDSDSSVVSSSAVFNSTSMQEGIWHSVLCTQEDSACTSRSFDSGTCQACKFIVNKHELNNVDTNATEYHYTCDVSSIPVFHGHLSEVVSNTCDICRGNKSSKRRSDISLVLGLVKQATIENVACIRSMFVLKHADAAEKSLKYKDDEGTYSDGGPLYSILITLEFFSLTALDTYGLQSISKPMQYTFNIVESQTFATQCRKPKTLPPASQLLLCLVSSDWPFLTRKMNALANFSSQSLYKNLRLRNDESNKKKVSSLFPSSMSLDAVYQFLDAKSTMTQTVKNVDEQFLGQAAMSANVFSLLSKDVLLKHIVPFLQARSLNNLRQSCKYLHTELKSAVPGLKLLLYPHQIESLSWMRAREVRSMTSDDYISKGIPSFEAPYLSFAESIDTDIHRAVSGGRTTLLATPLHYKQQRNDSVHIDQTYGHFVDYETTCRTNNRWTKANVMRGGLLCDDPGLGKTITVLSLILQTNGLSSEPRRTECVSPEVEREKNRSNLFVSYWNLVSDEYARRSFLLRLVNHIAKCVKGGKKVFSTILVNIDADKYQYGMEEFINEMKKTIDTNYGTDAASVQVMFEEKLQEAQNLQVKATLKRRSKNDRDLFDVEMSKYKKRAYDRTLVPSSATLLVIPNNLVEHWETQIWRHIDTKYVSSRECVIFRYYGSQSRPLLEKLLCDKSKFPFLFIDACSTAALPAPDELAMFRIVITTTRRFINEWKNGSMNVMDIENVAALQGQDGCVHSDTSCSLLRVKWLRMVVDEGHTLGKSNVSNTIQFASWITAERLWAITGTPTKQSAFELTQVKHLLHFLHHDVFSAKYGGEEVWRREIESGWKEKHLSSFYRVSSLIGFVMKRSCKKYFTGLKLPKFVAKKVMLSPIEVKTYNTIAAITRSNIYLSEHKGAKDKLGLLDSMLRASNYKFACESLANLRRACVGYSKVTVTLSEKLKEEAVRELQDETELDDSVIKEVEQYLYRTEVGEESQCAKCRMMLLTPIVMSCCGKLVCPECLTPHDNLCPVCEDCFDVDALQKVQPGFTTDWYDNIKVVKPGTRRKIEDERNDSSLSVADAVSQSGSDSFRSEWMDGVLGSTVPRKKQCKVGCRYSRLSTTGACTVCLHKHDKCMLRNKNRRCAVCFRKAIEPVKDESKIYYLVNKIKHLNDEAESKDGILKVIVFSQFRSALNLVGDRLLGQFGGACIAEYFGKYKTQELSKFTNDDQCCCMLLSCDGSEGLDLSFVSHIFFLDVVWNKALKEQAIARAWRMGSKQSVAIETILADRTVEGMIESMEEEMNYKTSNPVDAGSGNELTKKQIETSKMRYILENAPLVRYSTDDSTIEHNLATTSFSVAPTTPVATDSSADYGKKRARFVTPISNTIPSHSISDRTPNAKKSKQVTSEIYSSRDFDIRCLISFIVQEML